MLQQVLRRSFSTVQRQSWGKKALLAKATPVVGRRMMSGHGPDISRFEALLYITIMGGGFAAFGMYQAKLMRGRIEAFETGQVIPFKSLNDEDFAEFRQKFIELYGEEEEEE